VAFYIPELDGIGIVNRDFRGETPLGIPFSAMAGQCSGGKQVEGFSGLSLEYMRSPKFLQADGGYHRVIWMPRELKESVLEFIPEDVRDKIATEEDATSIKDLRRFLRDNEHPVLERAAVEETEPEEEEVEEAYPEETPIPEGVPVMAAPEMTLPAAGGFRIVLKNAKIYAEKVIIKRK
jgi:acetyl-CoA decarbonylase/synthase complex subunit beta